MSTFKQQCPSCESLVKVKDTMLGKKIECPKCKDRFIAERPDADSDDDIPQVKRDTKLGAKKNTALPKDGAAKNGSTKNGSTKNGAAKNGSTKNGAIKAGAAKVGANGKRPKLAVEDEDDDAKPQVKAGKPRPAVSNGKTPPKGRNHDDDEYDRDEADESETTPKKASAGSPKLLIGLGLAVVGVVILAVAAFFFMQGPRRPTPGPNVPGGPNANNGDKKKDDDPPAKKKEDQKPNNTPVPLSDSEVAKLSNMLPNDTDHVAHYALKNMFGSGSPVHDAVFKTPGALDDAELKKKLGFSVQAIDDMFCAERHTSPSWHYTVIHFQEPIQEAELKTALNLSDVTIEGKACFKTVNSHAWFDTLSRFSFGIPNDVRVYDSRSRDKPSYLRIHNAQTLIIGDEAPLTAFLKGQFEDLTPKNQPTNPSPGGNKGGAPSPMPGGGTPMPGGSAAPPGGKGAPLPTPTPGGAGSPAPTKVGRFQAFPFDLRNSLVMAQMTYRAPEGDLDADYFTLFQATPPQGPGAGNPGGGVTPGGGLPTPGGKPPTPGGNPPTPGGNPPNPGGNPPNPGGNPQPSPSPTPGNAAREDMYRKLKPTLKAIMDRMETRSDPKEKVFFSSATDMEANRIEVTKPGAKGVVRRPRQIWDVTLLLKEPERRIRYLGTSLIQKDTLKYTYRNEIQFHEGFAKDYERDMKTQTAPRVIRFIQDILKHEVRLAKEEPKTQPPIGNPGGFPGPGGGGPQPGGGVLPGGGASSPAAAVLNLAAASSPAAAVLNLAAASSPAAALNLAAASSPAAAALNLAAASSPAAAALNRAAAPNLAAETRRMKNQRKSRRRKSP
ncbi:MAG: hypothetical protein HYX68_25565 [Planctomycetes bacterium]|nr:hypothetical protein [Planctomycetota bacterium]